MARVELNINLNRVEGDLEIALVLEDGVVSEARTIGSLYRGFEQIMVGRAPRDSLVITPRVCGICGTAHLYSAVQALEQIWQIQIPANAVRIRNLCLIAEGIQNDLRQTFLFFTPDFCNHRYRNRSWFAEMTDRFEPFRGSSYRETLAISREAVKIVAHFGGQWPHSSYMLPGGVTTPATLRRITACSSALDNIQHWYEQSVIGHDLDDWLTLDSADGYFSWLETEAHASTYLGLLSHCARSLNLHDLAAGTPHMLSYGAWCDPERTFASDRVMLIPGGYYDGESGDVTALDQGLINEHVRHSWFRPYEGGRHP